MHKKALTVAIAGALAAPMAAQAVDFTLSGQVSRTLFVTQTNDKSPTDADSTKATIGDNNGATQVRAQGTSALDDGSEVYFRVEYAVDAGVTLRHAHVHYTGEFGRITFGQGSEAGDGSAGLGPSVTGIGAGQAGASTRTKRFFGSLDGGGRTNMIRYDTPAIGPVSAAVSLGNGDSISGLLALSSEFGGTAFAAKVGAMQGTSPVSGTKGSVISASTGVTLASGLAVGGAWGEGDDVTVGALGMPTCAKATVLTDCELMPAHSAFVTNPSYFRAGIGYTFGDTTVAASWYSSEDFETEGSEGTAMGIGASHTLAKVGATIHASVQNYQVKKLGTGELNHDRDETVFQLGTFVTF